MATVETNTVTLSINGREVTVPKGMSLVEAAAEAGIEVPVFCYEPRLGAAVGACRMCLVEIEGMPKLQTACTTPVADGMIVNSHSDRAREGQDAGARVPADQPPARLPGLRQGRRVPAAGPDLPLRPRRHPHDAAQAHAHDKPVPISPLIKLDRERCILCYRCTRFSEDVVRRPAAGDRATAAPNSIIATFEGRPYDGEFSGNVTELCPVGALTSHRPTGSAAGRGRSRTSPPSAGSARSAATPTPPSARARWRACCRATTRPSTTAGCATAAATRSPAWTPSERITTPLIRGGRGLEPVDGATALDHIADRLRAAIERFGPGSVAIIASGDQTSEEAHLWARIQEQALGGGPIVCGPEGGAGWACAGRATRPRSPTSTTPT